MALNKRRILIFSLMLILLGTVVLGTYLFNLKDYFGGSKAERLIARADENEERAARIVRDLTKAMEIDAAEDPQKAKRRYRESDNEIGEAREELETAITRMQEITALKVPIWQKNYADLRIQSLAAKIKMLNSLERWFSKMEFVADFLQRTTSAQQKFKFGLEQINESIEESNDKNYDKAKTKASKGKQLLDESHKLLQEADKMESTAGLAPVLTIVAEAEDFASLTIQLAEAGASNKIDEYNEIAERCENAKSGVLKEWGPEVIKNPKKWYSKKTKTLEKLIDNYALEALELKQSADVLYQRNTK